MMTNRVLEVGRELAYIGSYGSLFRSGLVAFKRSDLREPRWIRSEEDCLPDELAVPVPDNTDLSEGDFLACCIRTIEAVVL